jgi:hypothetical protein
MKLADMSHTWIWGWIVIETAFDMAEYLDTRRKLAYIEAKADGIFQ